jgi:hypothetical protein
LIAHCNYLLGNVITVGLEIDYLQAALGKCEMLPHFKGGTAVTNIFKQGTQDTV